MLGKEEFFVYIRDNIREYLPESYQYADIRLAENVKLNDIRLTTLLIRRPGETMIPAIYLDNLYDAYRRGKPAEECLSELAEVRVQANVKNEQEELFSDISRYDAVKDHLQIRACDYEQNIDRLQGKLYRREGDFALTYHIEYDMGETSANFQVTNDILSVWGVDEETVHRDALLADQRREPVLVNMEDIIYLMSGQSGYQNLLWEDGALDLDSGMIPMFILTNQKMYNGAGILFHDGMKEKISELMGGDYYVLPSSIHEVIIVPTQISVAELSEMVHTVNREHVEVEDRLSDRVQFYDSQAKALLNAEKWMAAHRINIRSVSPALRGMVAVSAASASSVYAVDKGTLPFGVLEALKQECRENRLEPYMNFSDPAYDVICQRCITERFDMRPQAEKTKREEPRRPPEQGKSL